MYSLEQCRKLDEVDLKNLRWIGIKEHENFFKRNIHLKNDYYNNLISICLTTNGALQYLNQDNGTNDFDIWHFYLECDKFFPYRAYKRISNGYIGKRIDFLKRAIPRHIYLRSMNEPEKVIINYLLYGNNKFKSELLASPIIGLYPDSIFGKVIWNK